MDFSMITKEYIRKHDFESDGISFRDTEKDVSYRLHQGDALPRALAQNSTKLRKEFVNLFYHHFDGNFTKLEALTGITEDAMRKYLRGNLKEKGRNISRMAVAKICVGIPLSLEEANKLFRLEGHSLEPESALLDAIVVDALNCGDDIETFYETCSEFKIKT
mgnify:FL=1